MSSEGKIGIALAAVALVAILWLVSRPEPATDRDVGSVRARAAKGKDGHGAPSDRVRERLARLRAERMAAGEIAPRLGGAKFPGTLPTPAFGALPEGGEPPAAEGEEVVEEDELDFESLRDMALIDEDPDNRIAAIWLLASMEDEEAVLPVLTQALSDEDPEVRMAAIQSLSEFSEDTPIESLNMALQDQDAEIRFEALSIVAEMNDERAQPLIAQALDDPDEDVRSLAEGLADLEETYEPAPTPRS